MNRKNINPGEKIKFGFIGSLGLIKGANIFLKLIEETHSIKLIVPCKKGISTIKHLRMATHYKFPVNLDKEMG